MTPSDKRLDRIENSLDRTVIVQSEISDNVTKALTILEELSKLKLNDRLSAVEANMNKAWGWFIGAAGTGAAGGFSLAKFFH